MPKIIKTPRIKRDPEEVLREAQVIYRTLLRWLHRHVVHDHRGCVAAAQKHLWWDTEGETTQAFCPVAMAFLRWRMQWEGCRIPSSLDPRNSERVPLGFIASYLGISQETLSRIRSKL